MSFIDMRRYITPVHRVLIGYRYDGNISHTGSWSEIKLGGGGEVEISFDSKFSIPISYPRKKKKEKERNLDVIH